ncbi:MAG: 4-hydroxy-3-methylbut-2-enyl diphosphate reductase [Bacilli bacterium]|nr:4-hydroxy-3-methylbut-2-enyl diphosphate reductase [Bacilli bacterium]
MEIIIAKEAGFCFGVKRAVDGAYNETQNKDKKIYCLGEIVHNNNVINQLKKEGITFAQSIDEIKEDNIKLIIRAHGIDRKIYNVAKKRNFEVIDFTCPLVKKTHDIAEKYHKIGYYIFLIGSKNHPEIIGTSSHCGKNYSVIESEEELRKEINNINSLKIEKLLVIVQTTFSKSKFALFEKIIRETINPKINLLINNTICNATGNRQLETEKLSKMVDLLIVVGGKNSSNTKKLYEVASKNCKSLLVENYEDIDLKFVKDFDKIGLVSGASTPIEIVNEIADKLKLL